MGQLCGFLLGCAIIAFFIFMSIPMFLHIGSVVLHYWEILG